MSTKISQVFAEARQLLGSRLWDTREGHVETGMHLSVVVSPSSLNEAFSVSLVTSKANVRPWGKVRATVGEMTEESSLDFFGGAVFSTLPAGLAVIELV